MKSKILYLKSWIILLAFVLSSCNKNQDSLNTSAISNSLRLEFKKNITLDISGGYPKLIGSPLFLSDQDKSYFYIPTGEGIGTFDLTTGGPPISNLKLSDIPNFMGSTTVGQNHFFPYSSNGFLYFDRSNDEILVLDNGEVSKSQKLSKIIDTNPKPNSGILKFAAFQKDLVTVLNMLEVYAKPPFQYLTSENSIGKIEFDDSKMQMYMPLPEKYLGKGVNVYDLFISMDYDQKNEEYIINFPVLDYLLVTKDFKSFREISATPKENFVKMENRSGVKMGEWRKEYYTDNSFFTVYYDPYRELYIRHYRNGLSETDFESLLLNSYKMLNVKNNNMLMFLNKEGKILHTEDVSEFNHLYIHFGKEGMYILNDTKLEDEDSLTFSLFEIKLD
ncbi:MAG: hypothetical protein ACI9UV_001568 [Algoriphagus sp.]|jgi:hypothetical protein